MNVQQAMGATPEAHSLVYKINKRVKLVYQQRGEWVVYFDFKVYNYNSNGTLGLLIILLHTIDDMLNDVKDY